MSTTRPKRARRDPGTTRSLILDQTERIMVEEGYAAVSSRRIAQELRINAATVHYYFPTTDDIFLALHERMTERQVAELEGVLQSDNPLVAYWEYQSSWALAALGVEFVALSNHRKTLRDRLSLSTDQARASQVSALTQAIAGSVTLPEGIDPMALATILTAIGRLLVNEERVGITGGHEAVRALVNKTIARLVDGQSRMPELL